MRGHDVSSVLPALFSSRSQLSSVPACRAARRAYNRAPKRRLFDREGTPMRKFAAVWAAALGLACFALTPAVAQDYPTKPVHMIVPYPAGGGTDVVARIIADHVSKILGQTIYIDNRGGANGAIGLTALKQAE